MHQRARDLLLANPQAISARDALHVAVMEHHGIAKIMTFDTDFDHVTHIKRVS